MSGIAIRTVVVFLVVFALVVFLSVLSELRRVREGDERLARRVAAGLGSRDWMQNNKTGALETLSRPGCSEPNCIFINIERAREVAQWLEFDGAGRICIKSACVFIGREACAGKSCEYLMPIVGDAGSSQ